MSSNSCNSCNSCNSPSNVDHRCRVCQHQRCRCPYCGPRASHLIRHKAHEKRKPKALLKLRGKVYCCKCTRNNKLGRIFDINPEHDKKLALIKSSELRKVSPDRLKDFMRNALKQKRHHRATKIACKHCVGSKYDPGNSGAGAPSLMVMDCRIPDYANIPGNLHRLDFTVRQVYSSVRRLITLLSGPRSHDTTLLRTVLQALLSQLANLNHRTFPSFAPGIFSKNGVFQHSLRSARGQVQTAYKVLWTTALRHGLLTKRKERLSVGSIATPLSNRRVLGLEAGAEDRVIVLRSRARELLDTLQLCAGMLRAWRSL